MSWIDDSKRTRLLSPRFSVTVDEAGTDAQFSLYLAVAAGLTGCEGWDRARVVARPLRIFDLCGLPLFYDFPVRLGREVVGSIRMAASKIFGRPLISISVTPPRWSLASAKQALQRLLETDYPGYKPRTPRLVCYNYPTLALSVDIVEPGGTVRTVLIDVADFSEIDVRSRVQVDALGQVAHSLLGRLTRARERSGPRLWSQRHDSVVRILRRFRRLAPRRFYATPSGARASAIGALLSANIVQLGWVRYLDYCCHGPLAGGFKSMGDYCRNHPCFCLHLQENSNSCARAVSQMILCYWRYCTSQKQIARAFAEPLYQVTDPANIEGGLETLTHECFVAKLTFSASWTRFDAEIRGRRPFLINEGNHATAGAGVSKFEVDGVTHKFVLTFDPSTSGNGKAWVEYDPTLFVGMATLVRKTTRHV
jgi:hypothetical protein